MLTFIISQQYCEAPERTVVISASFFTENNAAVSQQAANILPSYFFTAADFS